MDRKRTVAITEEWGKIAHPVELAIAKGHGLDAMVPIEGIDVLYTRDEHDVTTCLLAHNGTLYVGSTRCHWKDKNKRNPDWDDGYRHAFGRAIGWLASAQWEEADSHQDAA